MKFLKGMDLGTGLAIGIGTAILAPVVLPVLASAVKPVIKGGMKLGIILFEKSKVAAEEAKETWEDLAAEARSELQESEKSKVAALPEKKGRTAKATS